MDTNLSITIEGQANGSAIIPITTDLTGSFTLNETFTKEFQTEIGSIFVQFNVVKQ
jgi:hypothetical protein